MNVSSQAFIPLVEFQVRDYAEYLQRFPLQILTQESQ